MIIIPFGIIMMIYLFMTRTQTFKSWGTKIQGLFSKKNSSLKEDQDLSAVAPADGHGKPKPSISIANGNENLQRPIEIELQQKN
jgi:hypothetical protein